MHLKSGFVRFWTTSLYPSKFCPQREDWDKIFSPMFSKCLERAWTSGKVFTSRLGPNGAILFMPRRPLQLRKSKSRFENALQTCSICDVTKKMKKKVKFAFSRQSWHFLDHIKFNLQLADSVGVHSNPFHNLDKGQVLQEVSLNRVSIVWLLFMVLNILYFYLF